MRAIVQIIYFNLNRLNLKFHHEGTHIKGSAHCQTTQKHQLTLGTPPQVARHAETRDLTKFLGQAQNPELVQPILR